MAKTTVRKTGERLRATKSGVKHVGETPGTRNSSELFLSERLRRRNARQTMRRKKKKIGNVMRRLPASR